MDGYLLTEDNRTCNGTFATLATQCVPHTIRPSLQTLMSAGTLPVIPTPPAPTLKVASNVAVTTTLQVMGPPVPSSV